MTLVDPLLPFGSSLAEGRVTKYNCRSKRLVTGTSSAFAVV